MTLTGITGRPSSSIGAQSSTTKLTDKASQPEIITRSRVPTIKERRRQEFLNGSKVPTSTSTRAISIVRRISRAKVNGINT